MVKPKNTESEQPGNWLHEALERTIADQGDYIRTRFYVVERTPSRSYRVGDGHGSSDLEWTTPTQVPVSKYFPSKNDAQKWLDAHEPDDGNTLHIVEERLYQKLTEQWY